MHKSLKRIIPFLLILVILGSIVWYLGVYDRDFTRDMLLQQARFFDQRGNHTIASWLYDQAYHQSDDNAMVAIELAEQFKLSGNYTQAEVTLSRAIADNASPKLYIALCKTYVEQDKLLDAVAMLDNITDPTIRQQIDALRPAAPIADLAPGYYSQYMTVELSYQGGKLYLSTEEAFPSIQDAPSDGKLTLSGGTNTIYAIVVGDNGLVSPRAIFGYTISGVIEEVTIADPYIDAAVREHLQISTGETIYSNDLWSITELTLPEGALSYLDLASIPYLQTLTIRGSSAESLEGLASLSNLTELHITGSSLRTADLLTIASLPKLQKLTLSACGLSGIDNLAGAKQLQYLDLSDNSIRDFTGLSFLTGLVHLDLSHNALTSLNAASAMSALQYLDASYNSLTSIAPVAGCPQLLLLNVSNNSITSLRGVETLAQLNTLDASFNALTDILPLANCTALVDLDISSNSLTDISCLASLNGLQLLSFAHNSVTTLPSWNKDCQLVRIDGSYNKISVLGTLAGFANLNTIIMDYNTISVVNTLASCPNLIKVSVYGNPITDVSALTDMSIIVNYNPLT